MDICRFIDQTGRFQLADPEMVSGLYFPIANEQGLKSCTSPMLGGDSKLDQNHFLLQPVSIEDLHNNKSSRNFWCNVKGKGLWSATGMSYGQLGKQGTPQKEKTLVEGGFLYQKMYRVSMEWGIGAQILSYVSTEQNVEIMKVEIRNLGKEAIEFEATAAIPIYGRSADNIRDHRHVTSLLHQIETTEDGVFVKPTFSFDERGHQRNEMNYYVSGCLLDEKKPIGFYPTIEEYIGEGGDLLRPEALYTKKEKTVRGVKITGYEALGGICFEEVRLLPNEECSFLLLIGADTDRKRIVETINKYRSEVAVKQDFDRMQQYWASQKRIQIHSKQTSFDQMMQWVSFQPILRRIYGCSFLPHHDYGKGGRGFRDLWQDCLALTLSDPESIRETIINNYSGIRFDGSNATIIGSGLGEFLADRNNITRMWMDHGFWPLLTTNLYIQQTGDFAILQEETTYFKDKQIHRGEAVDEDWKFKEGNFLRTEEGTIYRGNVMEHILVENLAAFYDVGEHNHMRLRDADWNDALDMAGTRGESVAFTAAYAGNFHILHDLFVLLEKKGIHEIAVAQELQVLLEPSVAIYDEIEEKRQLLKNYCTYTSKRISGMKRNLCCKQIAKKMTEMEQWIKQHIRQQEWISDGEAGWFNGYYDNDGKPVEGVALTGNRMMLTSQVFTIWSETATKEQVKKMVQAADRYLYQKELGGYRLNTNFHEVKENLGRMFGFAYGHKENGAVFSHMTVMYGYVLYQRGFVKEGYKAIATLCEHANTFKVSKIYPGIPEYFNEKGRGMYHYLTGAASWMTLTVVTQMFGVRGEEGDLVLEPKLLLEQFDEKKQVSIRTMLSGHFIEVIYRNPKEKEYGDYEIKEVKVNEEDVQQETACLLRKGSKVRFPKSIVEQYPVEATIRISITLG
ncbi:GH36-type glycosyl hydrolase domain-containing protein [Anaerosporobacter faecicola]|uniref:GH36-type glycosyl hydrolase domain-containing protein n=1 Tax=Anaerosporobacter faecicola TaxID=2718714 RepID=UPI0014391C30|nr:cellobiose phosphorylase [Anaerosporobacter faecicola]